MKHVGTSLVGKDITSVDQVTAMILQFNQTLMAGALYSSGQQGAWYDESDLTTLYQDSAGTTLVTAVEQPVGLVLDKRFGAVRGAEAITAAADRDFSSDTGFWTKSAGWAIGSGVATKTGSLGANLYRSALLTIGSIYEVSIEVVSISGTLTVFVGVVLSR